MGRIALFAPAALSLAATACSPTLPPPPPPPTVSVGLPLKRQVMDWDDYVGRFEAVQDVEIRPRISGTVQSVAFREGVEVAKEQVLFVIDPDLLADPRFDFLRELADLTFLSLRECANFINSFQVP
jgi:multidrug efflux pump subunit AcrA (membrane-fusion protein)